MQVWEPTDQHDQAMSTAERMRRYRAKRRALKGQPAFVKGKPKLRPFVGCDGEGGGYDDLGRQDYRLLRIGDRELCTGNRLTTEECLEFILGAPRNAILVGFAFGYDTTMILRDLVQERPPEPREDGKTIPTRLDRLFTKREWGEGKSPYTWVGNDYGVEYLPKNYLRVCRYLPGKGHRIEKGSTRTIHDVFGSFQKSFLKSIQMFDIGQNHWERIAIGKEDREDFGPVMTDEIRGYCAAECDLLADMMERFRENCYATLTDVMPKGIRPRMWTGAGQLASALHTAYQTPKQADLAHLPDKLIETAEAAYYGGRFETTKVGEVAGPIHEYDLRSAYPAAMQRLPCLLHGQWHFETKPARMRKHFDAGALCVAQVKFQHEVAEGVRPNLYGLPVRLKDGRLIWPNQGQGVYWSPEIRSAMRLGCVPKVGAGWRYEPACSCTPFAWVKALYDRRMALGKDQAGYPLKLGINALYGKTAQRIGNPKWANMIHAGLITAYTRAALNEAAAADPGAVIMVATDAIFASRPLAVPISEALGDWEAQVHPRMFIVQPGLYWGTPKVRSRGIRFSFFAEHTGKFEAAWADWAERYRAADRGVGYLAPPSVTLNVKLFIGLKLAHARHKPDTAGKWVRPPRTFSFDWTGKRAGDHLHWDTPLGLATMAPAGAHDLISKRYDKSDPVTLQLDEERAELEDQPEPIDFSAPFIDD